VKVADPYRWLENESADETVKWVDAENKVTFGYLEKIPYREALKARLSTLQNYARFGAPARKGEHYVFSKNDGLQNQRVIYIQKGLAGTPDVLLDPNTFSADGTSRLANFALSKDGRYLAYGISTGGSDWTEFRVMEVATRKPLPDVIRWAKVTGIAWQGDGFFYSGYDAPDSATALTSKNEGHKVYYHKVGTPQSPTDLVYEDKGNPQRFHTVATTEDNATPSFPSPIAGRARRATPSSTPTRRTRRGGSRSSRTSAAAFSSTRITVHPTVAWCSSIRRAVGTWRKQHHEGNRTDGGPLRVRLREPRDRTHVRAVATARFSPPCT
jgi:hypothetical protein